MCSRFNQTVHHSFPLFVVLFCFIIFFLWGSALFCFFLFFLWGSALCCLFLIYLMYCKIHTTLGRGVYQSHNFYINIECMSILQRGMTHNTCMPTFERLQAVVGVWGGLPPLSELFFQKDAKWCILLHFGYKICVVKTLNNRGFSGRTKRS
jgi:hypothetical protein